MALRPEMQRETRIANIVMRLHKPRLPAWQWKVEKLAAIPLKLAAMARDKTKLGSLPVPECLSLKSGGVDGYRNPPRFPRCQAQSLQE